MRGNTAIAFSRVATTRLQRSVTVSLAAFHVTTLLPQNLELIFKLRPTLVFRAGDFLEIRLSQDVPVQQNLFLAECCFLAQFLQLVKRFNLVLVTAKSAMVHSVRLDKSHPSGLFGLVLNRKNEIRIKTTSS